MLSGNSEKVSTPEPLNLLNTAYKTNEYHLGRPVYCKLFRVTCTTETSYRISINESNMLDKWVAYGYWTNKNGEYLALQHQYGISSIYLASKVNLTMIQGHYFNGWTAYIMLKFTKSTDPVVS